MTDKIYAFSNGTQYTSWMDRNCVSCQKWCYESAARSKCDIDKALADAYCSDGSISKEIAHRMGRLDNDGKFWWHCPERIEGDPIE